MSEKEKPERYGRPWTQHERMFAVQACKAGAGIPNICRALKRPYDGVTSKLYPDAVDRDTRTGVVTVKRVDLTTQKSVKSGQKPLAKNSTMCWASTPTKPSQDYWSPRKPMRKPRFVLAVLCATLKKPT